MGHYRIYQLDPSDHITAGFSVECGSDAAAMRAARTLLERSAGVEVWKSNHRLAHLSAEARQLWDQVAGRVDGVLLAARVLLLNLKATATISRRSARSAAPAGCWRPRCR